MNETKHTPKPWWQTLPGILTAVSGIIVALSGLIGALHQAGMLGGEAPETVEREAPVQPTEEVASAPAQSASPASSTSPHDRQPEAAGSPDRPVAPATAAASPPAASDPRPMSESEAVFTTLTGETSRIDAGSLYLGHSEDGKTLPLTSGQSVDFDRIHVIEVTGIEHTELFETFPDEAGQPEVRIRLLSGRTLTGTVKVPDGRLGTPYFFLTGESELGEFRIRPWEVVEIRFER